MLNTCRGISITLAVLALTACASAPSWQHTVITNKATAARQLVIDEGNCTLISMGAAPIPEIPASTSPQTTNITLSGSAYNTTTGARSYGTYTGQATSAPSGGFAGGFASGMASGASLGAAIAAQRAQDSILRSCMYSKGWTDSALEKTANTTTTTQARQPDPPAEIYVSAQAEWAADNAEFLNFFPAYRTGDYFDRLNQKVKELAAAKDMTGPQYLLMALTQLTDEGRQAPLAPIDEGGYRVMYTRSVAGDMRAQSSLGLAYAQGKDLRTPVDTTRSAYWSRKSALAGDPVGQLGYGILLFNGNGLKRDRINGYRWMKKAAESGLDAASILNRFEQEMSPSELERAK